MLVDCPGCARSYHVSSADLGGGRTLICPRCDVRWHQDVVGPELALSAVSARASAGLDEVPLATRRFVPSQSAMVTAGIALACLAFASLVLARDTVVRAMPRTAALYAAAGLPVNVVGLAFARVTPERLATADVMVHGALRNVAGHKVRVPRLAFEVHDATGTTLVAWSETMPAKAVAAGRELDFTSSPHRLPDGSRTVWVRFE